MSLSKASLLASAGAISLAGCTIEPLATARNDTAVASGTGVSTSRALERSVTVSSVSSRVSQQVRNALLFALHGGSPPLEPAYSVKLSTKVVDTVLAIRDEALAPTAAKITLTTSYTLKELSSGNIVLRETISTVAAYDRTSQSFANSRAQRDAENRAAQQSAQRIRLSLARQLVVR